MPTRCYVGWTSSTAICRALRKPENKLCFEHRRQQNKNYILEADCVVAATGYRYPNPKFLQNLQSFDHTEIRPTIGGVASNFKVNYQGEGSIFIQNMEVYHYGVGTPDLGLGHMGQPQLQINWLVKSYSNLIILSHSNNLE